MRKYDNFEYKQDLINESTNPNTKLIIVIPSFYELYIKNTLQSLTNCNNYSCNVEVLIIINERENISEEISAFHFAQYHDLTEWSKTHNTEKLSFYPILCANLDSKSAGVGLARKIGMDEAYKRFLKLNELNGIIICLDADTIVAQNYLHILENEYYKSDKIKAYSIHFKHPLDEANPNYHAIIDYELHLRYYINMQRLLGLPFAFYTFGSAMAVRVLAYGEAFGMNKLNAGEDFYFLHKFIKTGYFGEINETTVLPSSRFSDRVPFGTGKSMTKQSFDETKLLTYNYRSFEILKSMTDNLQLAYMDTQLFLEKIDPKIIEFLIKYDPSKKINEIKKHTSNYSQFTKRFFIWFDAFLLMKYLHFMRDNYYPDIPVLDAANYLLSKLDLQKAKSEKDALLILRRLDKT